MLCSESVGVSMQQCLHCQMTSSTSMGEFFLCHIPFPFPSEKVQCLGLAQEDDGVFPLSDYRETDFKRNPKEIENTSLFKHAFQRKKNPNP